MTESLAPIEVVDSASWRIDRPISARLPCPSPAMLAVWLATSLTSFMVLSNSRLVAEICLTAAAAWLVEAP